MVAGRAFAFADPQIIKLATEAFIPVCADDWYQRRRQDAEGEFFRSVANQGPRKGEKGATRQGIYTLTADGELLAFKNAGQDVEATRDQLERALKKWNSLPQTRTKPSAVIVPEHGPLDERYSRVPPEGGLIVAVNGRILDRKNGEWVRGNCDHAGGANASRDFLWLTAAEAASMLPTEPAPGVKQQVPAAIARRIARFHLVDNTRGEPNFWKAEEIHRLEMTLEVMEHSPTSTSLTLSGRVLLRTARDDRGYDAVLAGTLRFNRVQNKIDMLEIVAVGDHWGDDSFTGSGARPGKTPFGVAFGLVDPAVPMNRVPPQAARDPAAYFAKD